MKATIKTALVAALGMAVFGVAVSMTKKATAGSLLDKVGKAISGEGV